MQLVGVVQVVDCFGGDFGDILFVDFVYCVDCCFGFVQCDVFLFIEVVNVDQDDVFRWQFGVGFVLVDEVRVVEFYECGERYVVYVVVW